MEIGDIYAVEIPSSNGHEQAGVRPAIIVQATAFAARLPTTLIVPLTSQFAATSFAGTFLIQPDAENQLNANSFALVFQLRAIDKRRVKRKIGKLNDADLAKLYSHLKALMHIP
ncbi:MAG: type II toxin-antitoxin system PemK/MazF family toxin [Acidobacteria bacterium]|nr:type II toxin-antitoxin system PemK/MazF family toxin [Acidobacteriota bacterium]